MDSIVHCPLSIINFSFADNLLPPEDGTIATSWVGTSKIHGIWTACGGALSDVAMILQGIKHEVMVKIVLPEEHLGLLRIVREAHIASQTLAIDLHITAIDTLQRHLALSTIDKLETGALASVSGMRVVEQAMRIADGRTIGSLIDDSECLTEGDVARTIGTGFIHREIIELGKAAILTLRVESEQGMAGALECDELIAQWHHATNGLEVHAVGGISILSLIMVVVANAAQPDLTLWQFNRHIDRVVGQLLKTTQPVHGFTFTGWG